MLEEKLVWIDGELGLILMINLLKEQKFLKKVEELSGGIVISWWMTESDVNGGNGYKKFGQIYEISVKNTLKLFSFFEFHSQTLESVNFIPKL